MTIVQPTTNVDGSLLDYIHTYLSHSLPKWHPLHPLRPKVPGKLGNRTTCRYFGHNWRISQNPSQGHQICPQVVTLPPQRERSKKYRQGVLFPSFPRYMGVAKVMARYWPDYSADSTIVLYILYDLIRKSAWIYKERKELQWHHISL